MAEEDDSGRSDYGSVRVPADLKKRLDEFVEDNDWGYRSRTEVTATALRDFLRKYGGE